MLAISEIFGPTIQGEGPSVGRRAVFLRLAGCNLHCTWCDTPYTWDWTRYDPKAEIKRMAVGEVQIALSSQMKAGDILVVTGGEPLLQAKNLERLIALYRNDCSIEIETNGTVPLPLGWTHYSNLSFNVSPKLKHGGDPEHLRLKIPALESYAGANCARFKFVVERDSDIDEIKALMEQVDIDPKAIWLMPQGRTVEEIDGRLQMIVPVALREGWNISDRLHLRIWGNQRGH